MANELTSYGRKRLGSIYNKYKDNTSFDTVEDFFAYALQHGYKDWLEVNLEVDAKGLIDDNIEFRHAKSRVRLDRMGLSSSDIKLSYGSKVNILKEFSYELGELETKYHELLCLLDLIDSSSNKESVRIIRAYLNNAIDSINSVFNEVDKMDLK